MRALGQRAQELVVGLVAGVGAQMRLVDVTGQQRRARSHLLRRRPGRGGADGPRSPRHRARGDDPEPLDAAAAQHVDHAHVGERRHEQVADALDDLRDRDHRIGDLGRAAQQREVRLIVGEPAPRPRGGDGEGRAREHHQQVDEVVARAVVVVVAAADDRRESANAATAAVARGPAKIAVRNGPITTVDVITTSSHAASR